MNLNKTGQKGVIFTGDEAAREIQIPFPRIGILRIGEEKSPKRPGKAIDWFRATGEYAQRFHDIFGEKPTSLTIAFPSSDPYQVCQHVVIGRDSNGNKSAIFDGENYKLWNYKSRDYVPVSYEQWEEAKQHGVKALFGYGDNERVESVKIETWQNRLTLRFITIGMLDIVGYWELGTSSIKSGIPQITETFLHVANKVGHAISNMTFDISVRMQESNSPGQKRKYPVLSLTPNLSFESLNLLEEYKDTFSKTKRIITDSNINKLIEDRVVDDEHLLDGLTDQQEEVEQREEGSTSLRSDFSPAQLKDWVINEGQKKNAGDLASQTLAKIQLGLEGMIVPDDLTIKLLGKHVGQLTEGEGQLLLSWIKNPKIKQQIQVVMSNE